MDHKSVKKKIITYMCMIICMAVLLQICIMGFTNLKQVRRTSQIMLDQVDNILTVNEQNEQETIEELKEEYIEKAKTVSCILENDRDAVDNIIELKQIADMMSLDEINIFDENGVIVRGTHSGYYGVSFDSGRQVGYFKPMLYDRDLTMCQDVTPNTALSKSMMYAITWNETKEYMIQVGVEPVRLINVLNKNSISEVVSQMPVYDGMIIYIADINTGEIEGSTDKSLIGHTVYESRLMNEKDDLHSIKSKILNRDGFGIYCYYRQHGDYIIAFVHSTKANLQSFIVSTAIEIGWLILAGGLILFIMFKLANANKKINDQMSILSSISDIYYSMHLIDMSDYRIERLEANDLMDQVIGQSMDAAGALDRIIRLTIQEEYIDASLAFTDLSTLKERMKNRKTVFMDVINKNVGWLRVSFITVKEDPNGCPEKVIIATQVIDEEKKREEELSIKVIRDELTGLLNRRAYESDIMLHPDVPPEADFVYAAIDINGLKVCNDTIGHAAGDEMIRGAAECLSRTLGSYGKVYRTGGDEFVSIFFADEDHLRAVNEDLEAMTGEWKGRSVPSLSVSVGYAAKREFADKTLAEIAKIADQRMYKAKAEYYSRKGIDRRGHAAAQTALCDLYTSILRIDLTDDSYTVIRMDKAHEAALKRSPDRISECLYSLAVTSGIHPDDRDEYLKKTDISYLREYFKKGMTGISIMYRTEQAGTCKRTLMEIIKADDHDDSSQGLFLYIRDTDL